MNIENATVIVTGGASGMGAATVKLLRQQGAHVSVLDLNGDGIHCDVTDENSVKQAMTESQKKYGIARICINCAGVVHARRMVNQKGAMPLDEFSKIISINLIGTFNVMRLAASAMMTLPPIDESGERGVIINTASIAAFEGQIGQTAYSASKGGIVSLTLPAARELAPFGIRVMTIAPGLVDTPMFQSISPEAKASLACAVPFPKRLAHPEEYAKLAQHIIENAMLNGEVIRLDGALRLQEK